MMVQKRTWAEEGAGKEISVSHLGDADDCTSKEIDASAVIVVLKWHLVFQLMLAGF